jgi:hypothetical protein
VRDYSHNFVFVLEQMAKKKSLVLRTKISLLLLRLHVLNLISLCVLARSLVLLPDNFLSCPLGQRNMHGRFGGRP